MSVEERRAHIVDAVTPLLTEHGADLTTRELAHAAGVAEGTLFRAFRDKEELIAAVVERCMDPAPIVASLRAIPVEQSLEDTLRQIVAVLRERFTGVLGVMNALGIKEPPMHDHSAGAASRGTVIEELLAPHRECLSVEPAKAVILIRLLCFSASVPSIAGRSALSDEELVHFILCGISTEGP